MTEKKYSSIGLFDSGMGGLSILLELKKKLKNENFIYFADNLNSPYGNYNDKKIIELSMKNINYMLTKNLKALIIACNTVTAAAIKHIREMTDIIIIGVEPAILPAIKETKTNKILLLATKSTLKNRQYDKLYNDKEIFNIPCENLAEIIENNYDNDKLIYEEIQKILFPYKNCDYDGLVLGCTHYVLKKELFKKACDKEIILYDGNIGTANNTIRILNKNKLLNDRGKGFTKLIMTDGITKKYKLYKKIISKG